MASNVSHIILGIDFSKYSKTVIKQARSLAFKLNVPLVLVHCFEDPIENDWQEAMVRGEINRILTEKVKSFYSVIAETVVIKRGKPYKQILSVAKSYPRSLIIAGHRGHSSILTRFFLGSTAERLALKTTVPMIIFRGKDISSVQKVLIPTDLSDGAGRTLKGLKQLGYKNLKLELLHVILPPPPIFEYDDWSMIYGDFKANYSASVEKFRQKFKPIKLTAVMANNVAGEIQKKSRNFDLIAISPGLEKGYLSDLGSVTAKVVRSGNTSILIVP